MTNIRYGNGIQTYGYIILRYLLSYCQAHEAGLISIEGGFDNYEISKFLKNHPSHKVWESSNLFFGGTHSVSSCMDGFHGIGDPRRGGYALEVS